jgi:hypothetical protein
LACHGFLPLRLLLLLLWWWWWWRRLCCWHIEGSQEGRGRSSGLSGPKVPRLRSVLRDARGMQGTDRNGVHDVTWQQTDRTPRKDEEKKGSKDEFPSFAMTSFNITGPTGDLAAHLATLRGISHGVFQALGVRVRLVSSWGWLVNFAGFPETDRQLPANTEFLIRNSNSSPIVGQQPSAKDQLLRHLHLSCLSLSDTL